MSSDFNEEDETNNRFEDSPRSPDEIIQRARSRVMTPAILLIATGGLGLVLTVLNFIQLPGMEGKFNEAIANIDKDPNIPAEQKKQQKEMVEKFRDAFMPAALPLYVTNALVSIIVIAGGLMMRSLSGRGLAMIASILAMLPIINGCCCLLGLPSGIWALIALSKPAVKAGFAAVASGGSASSDY